MGSKNYLEINGKKYDASTGDIVGNSTTEPLSVNHIAPKIQPPHGQVMDGIVRRLAAQSVPAAARKIKKTRPLSRAAQTAHKKTQHASTLMRPALRKPSLASLLHAKAAPVATSAVNIGSINEIPAWPGISKERVSRAHKVRKSKLISRFGPVGLLSRTAVLPVKAPPQQKADAKKERLPAKQAGQANPFMKALDTASSHKEPKLKQQRLHHRAARKLHISPKTLNIGAGALAALLIGVFVFLQNLPNLQVRLAAARAGFRASLPTYHPSGFSLKGPIEYAPGELTVSFKSNSDNRAFQVKQQTSNWNSETLLATYVSKGNQPYQTYQDNGRTVYIDKSGANLVTGNKWIQVKSDGSLSTGQLLSIVKSIN